ncbi:MAG: nuclease-related domain-containing protein [Cyanobacteria bacterium]|nr:nuclease-related domain-containing protein [Cyanobacteriota bacterium]
MFQKKQAWKSPLKASPHRSPGQSLDEQISEVMFDSIAFWVAISSLLVSLVIIEWFRWAYPTSPEPVLTTILITPLLGFSVFKLLKLRTKIKLLKLARDGEKAIGQFLEDFRSEGCRVFHDIIGDGFNIDHLLISPHGIFTVETKTFRKPPKGKPTVYFDGETLVVKGKKLDRDPIVQAKAQANWTKEMLQGTSNNRKISYQ